MARLPFLKFYVADHMAEVTLRQCSLAARGLWMEMLSLMHLCARRGYLLAASGTPLTPDQLARLTGCSAEEVSRLLAELRSSGVFSCTTDGAIYCRRMVRDEGKRERCSSAGKKGGGNPSLGRGTDREASQPAPLKEVPKVGPKVPPKVVPNLETRDQITSPPEKCGAADPVSREPEKPDKAPSNPNHKPAIEAFCNAWGAKYGAKYKFNRGKDAKIVADVLVHLGNDLETFQALVMRYLADDDPFVVQAGHVLALLLGRVNRYTAAGAKPRPPGRFGFVDFDTQPPREAA